MKAFIDELRVIRIETDQYITHISAGDLILSWVKNDNGNQYFKTDKDIDIHEIESINVDGQTIHLHIGLVTLTDAFDKKYQYDGPLGVFYTHFYTDFYLFTPVAREVNLVIGNKTYPTLYQDGVRYVRIHGDLEGKRYYYRVRLEETWYNVKDPYANAQGLAGNYIIDWDKTIQSPKTPIKLKKYVDAVIYEGHVRDMTVNLDVEHKGTFNGLYDHSKHLNMRVIDYVKHLGITHLQLLPVYDFELVDELKKNKRYNWGYNPSQYFCLEGWYAVDPQDPYDRINAFKTLINEAHQIGLGINMDVVYNHVFNNHTFPYDYLVPGYFYRHDENHKMTDSSYCGNDLETRHYMVRRLIKDSLIQWADVFKVDGFRFDLMGLMDVKTMKDIEVALKKINPSVMLYGEGWNMDNAMKPNERANQHNQSKFKTYAHFNDFFRNTLKGELHSPQPGFSMGNHRLIQRAMTGLIGSPHMFSSPTQSINYVECHDNLTYYDAEVLKGFQVTDLKVSADLAMHMIAISQGIPFYHAGQEFYRTKKGVENSFESPDEINQIIWRDKEEAVTKLKKLLKIRKRFGLYRLASYNEEKVSVKKEGKLIVYTLQDDKNMLIHYIKNYFGLESLPLNQGKLIFPSQKALTEERHIYVDQPGIYIVHIKK